MIKLYLFLAGFRLSVPPRCEAELAAQERRIAELEAELRLIGGTIHYLERALGEGTRRALDRADQERQHREIAEEVEADLFAEDLANPPEERG